MTTPGPWKWRDMDDLRTLYERGEYRFGEQVLGIVTNDDGSPEIRMSDADRALVEAAPETAAKYAALLAVARDVVNAEASVASCHIHGAPADLLREHRAELQRAFAALRAAVAEAGQ